MKKFSVVILDYVSKVSAMIAKQQDEPHKTITYVSQKKTKI